MAPRFGTGIGMTENAGFATFTPGDISIEEMAGQVGRAFDNLAEVSVRAPMASDGTAGAALKDGEIGEDQMRRDLDKLQELTDGHITKLDAMLERKEKEVMEV